mmetsp:Transcript_26494/g.57511  ORF Transcript_26494/g.57511 Transcript_26494/m.57511 type:complete len:417 (-) Transcript_26494:61-1311(-)|eukprot:CAMPEP_0206466166 /NCGR_PEP_ID=MMETSP0324_2-20121206/28292_1 /ASSEMBLY_ACC=CAM_ASM_000836 /TAXON_ID=2866 /ORGANISM="Crypthecodinium cohnii, Strain Seligo" /LENGTH=416 /DNA_ID=CAMNT_0053939221 /DNA_START=418 /DNA_END=1668 /DNA_ORIENTATION=-
MSNSRITCVVLGACAVVSQAKHPEVINLWGLPWLGGGGGDDAATTTTTMKEQYDCSTSGSDWSKDQRDYCCSHHSQGCSDHDHPGNVDCVAGFASWRTSWSEEKQEECCRRFGRACPDEKIDRPRPPSPAPPAPAPTTSEAPTTSSSSTSSSLSSSSSSSSSSSYNHNNNDDDVSSSSSSSRTPLGPLGETTSLPFDCTHNMVTWETAWSAGKKAWCCLHEQTGCPRDYDCNEGSPDSWTPMKRDACSTTTTRHTTTELEIYDCGVGYEHWQSMWTQEKKNWCCRHHEKGCPDSAPIDDGTRYDCQANFEHWLTLWMPSKRAWCCDHEPNLAAHAMCFVSEDKFDVKDLRPEPAPTHKVPAAESVIPLLFWLSAAAILVGLVIRQVRPRGSDRGRLRLRSLGTDEEIGLQASLAVE